MSGKAFALRQLMRARPETKTQIVEHFRLCHFIVTEFVNKQVICCSIKLVFRYMWIELNLKQKTQFLKPWLFSSVWYVCSVSVLLISLYQLRLSQILVEMNLPVLVSIYRSDLCTNSTRSQRISFTYAPSNRKSFTNGMSTASALLVVSYIKVQVKRNSI